MAGKLLIIQTRTPLEVNLFFYAHTFSSHLALENHNNTSSIKTISEELKETCCLPLSMIKLENWTVTLLSPLQRPNQLREPNCAKSGIVLSPMRLCAPNMIFQTALCGTRRHKKILCDPGHQYITYNPCRYFPTVSQKQSISFEQYQTEWFSSSFPYPMSFARIPQLYQCHIHLLRWRDPCPAKISLWFPIFRPNLRLFLSSCIF